MLLCIRLIERHASPKLVHFFFHVSARVEKLLLLFFFKSSNLGIGFGREIPIYEIHFQSLYTPLKMGMMY